MLGIMGNCLIIMSLVCAGVLSAMLVQSIIKDIYAVTHKFCKAEKR